MAAQVSNGVFVIKRGSTSQALPFLFPYTPTPGGSIGLSYWSPYIGALVTVAISAVDIRSAFTSAGYHKFGTGTPVSWVTYIIGIPDAVFALSGPWVFLFLADYDNSGDLQNSSITLVQLVDYDPQSGSNLGLSALPTAAPAANGGLPTVNASNYVAGVAGTINTLDALDTALGTDISNAASSINSNVTTETDALDTAVGDVASAIAALENLSQAQVESSISSLVPPMLNNSRTMTMKKLKKGSTNVTIPLILNNKTASDATNLRAYYYRQGAAAKVDISLAWDSNLPSIHTDGAVFRIDLDAQNGSLYLLGVPDAAFATGADWVIIALTNYDSGDSDNVDPAYVLVSLETTVETDLLTAINSALTDFYGEGADACTISVLVGSIPVADADVWITTDAAGENVVAGTVQTDSNGEVTFRLDAGSTYYLWAQKDGVMSIQGESFVAVAD